VHHDLYLPDSPFGPKLVKLTFELLYLWLPQVAKWAATFTLKTWNLDSAPDYIKVFLVVGVNASDPPHFPGNALMASRWVQVKMFDPAFPCRWLCPCTLLLTPVVVQGGQHSAGSTRTGFFFMSSSFSASY
jgi:hypothetical protein